MGPNPSRLSWFIQNIASSMSLALCSSLNQISSTLLSSQLRVTPLKYLTGQTILTDLDIYPELSFYLMLKKTKSSLLGRLDWWCVCSHFQRKGDEIHDFILLLRLILMCHWWEVKSLPPWVDPSGGDAGSSYPFCPSACHHPEASSRGGKGNMFQGNVRKPL